MNGWGSAIVLALLIGAWLLHEAAGRPGEDRIAAFWLWLGEPRRIEREAARRRAASELTAVPPSGSRWLEDSRPVPHEQPVVRALNERGRRWGVGS